MTKQQIMLRAAKDKRRLEQLSEAQKDRLSDENNWIELQDNQP